MVLVLLTALVLGTAVLAAAWAARGSLLTLVLGTYVLAFAEIVVLCFAVSAVDALDRRGLLVAATIVAVPVAAVALVRRPSAPRLAAPWAGVRSALADRAVLLLAGVAALELAYTTSLALFTA